MVLYSERLGTVINFAFNQSKKSSMFSKVSVSQKLLFAWRRNEPLKGKRHLASRKNFSYFTAAQKKKKEDVKK